MSGYFIFERRTVGGNRAFSHRRFPDNQGRTVFLSFRCGQGFPDFFRVVSRDGNDQPAPGFVFHGYILAVDIVDLRGKLDVIGIVEHDQVVEAQVSGYTACALGYFFLNASIGDKCINRLVHHFAETGFQEFGGDGRSHGIGVSLSERSGSVFHAAINIHFRMSGRRATPLTKLF